MKGTARIQETFFSVVRSTKEEFQKIKWEELNILQKLVDVHDKLFKTEQRNCLESDKHQRKVSFEDEDSPNESERKFIFDFSKKGIDSTLNRHRKNSPRYHVEARHQGNKTNRILSSRQSKSKTLLRSVSKTGKRTLPSSPPFTTKRFDLNRLSSKRRKLPQPPNDRKLHQNMTWSNVKTKDQEVKDKNTKLDEQKYDCSAKLKRRPLSNVYARDGFVRPAAWASIRPQITKPSDDVPFCIPAKHSPVGNRQKMLQRSESTALKNENAEYERGRLLSFRTFFRREFENYYSGGKSYGRRSQGKASAADELETYLVNKKLQRACHDILRQ